MEQFAAVKRKDGQPVRYLVVDDSVFARKNLARMIESFGGQVAGEAGDGCTAITEYDRTKWVAHLGMGFHPDTRGKDYSPAMTAAAGTNSIVNTL